MKSITDTLIQPRRRRRRHQDYKRWERSAPMQLWQLDITGQVMLADGREVKLITGVDDHSRFCVIARVVGHCCIESEGDGDADQSGDSPS